jgi:spore coat protein U-like protein
MNLNWGLFKHMRTQASVSLSISALFLATISLGLLSSNQANAGTLTASTKATATLASSCSLSVSNFSLGNISASSISDTTTYQVNSGNIAVTCSKGVSYQIFMNNGLYSTTARDMKGASKGDTIPYTICRVSTVNGSQCSDDYWGEDSAHSLQSVGTGALQNLPAYLMYKKGFYTPDNYSDTMTATLSF